MLEQPVIQSFGEYLLLERLRMFDSDIDPSVYRAVDRSFAQQFAVIRAEHRTNTPPVNSKLLQKLQHPNLYRFIDYLVKGIHHGVVTELPEGTPLSTLQLWLGCMPHVKLPAQLALYISAEICAGLQYAYSNEVSHDLLLPEEVTLTAQGEIKLHGLGFADRFPYWSSQILRNLNQAPEPERTMRRAIPRVGWILDELKKNFVLSDPLDKKYDSAIREVIQRAQTNRYQNFTDFEVELRALLGPGDLRAKLVEFISDTEEKYREETDTQEQLNQSEEPFFREGWLIPDAELDMLSEGSISWLEERFDEHLSVLSHFSQEELPRPKLLLTRSLFEAMARVELAKKRPTPSQILHWREACLAATQQIESLQLTKPQQEALDKLLQSAKQKTWSIKDLPRASLVSVWYANKPPDSHLKLLGCHMRSQLGEDPSPSSPWGPLLSIWERGAWPIALLREGLLVYVPVRRFRSIVFDHEQPALLPVSMEFRGFMRSPFLIDRCFDPRASVPLEQPPEKLFTKLRRWLSKK